MTTKKFNELFDNEDLYSKSEIPFLTGELLSDVKRMIKDGEIIDFNQEIPQMMKLYKQLYLNFPFLQHVTGMATNKDGNGIAFVFTDGQETDNGFIFSVEYKGDDKYDLVHGIIEDGEEYSKEEKSLSFKQVINLIGSIVYPNLKRAINNFKEQGIEIVNFEDEDKEREIKNFSPMFNSVIYNFDEYTKLLK